MQIWKINLLFLSVLPLSASLGQTISGFVRDSMGEALAFASVVATSCSDDRVLGFTQTDDHGQYRIVLNAPCDTVTVSARFIGFRAASIRVATIALPPTHDFWLAPAVLQTVVIKGKSPPIVVRGDTTEFNVSSFADSTEVSVEDLIKKLPGFSVAENGVIQYNGKLVERVMIEGDDIFGEQYTLGTRNIRADMFSKVQVVDRFQENPLMQGVRESDRMVLNLKISPDRKRALSGNVELGAGAGEDWKGLARCNLFSIGSREKVYLIGNANNSGRNPLSWVEWQARGGATAALKPQSLQSNPLPTRPLLPEKNLDNAGLPWEHTQNNRSHLLYTGLVLPSGNNAKTTVSGWIGQTKLDQIAGSRQRFLIGSDVFEITEGRDALNNKSAWAIQAESAIFPKESSKALRSFVKYARNAATAQTRALRTQSVGDPFFILESLEQTSDDWFISLEYTFKKKSNEVIQLASKTSVRQEQYMLGGEYGWYASYFQVDSNYRFMQQPADQVRRQQLLTLSWLGSRKTINWSVDGGLNWFQGRIRSDAFLLNPNAEQLPLGTNYANDLTLSTVRGFVLPALSWRIGSVALKANLNIAWQSARQVNTGKGAPLDLWTLEPRFDIRLPTGPYGALGASGEIRQQTPDIIEMRTAFLFSGYQSLGKGLPVWVRMPGRSVVLLYRYAHPVRQTNWHVNLIAGDNAQSFGSSTTIDPFLTVSEAIWPADFRYYTVNGHAEHYFSSIRTRLEAGIAFNQTEQMSAVNSASLTNLTQNSISVQAGGGTAFDGWVNVLLSNQLTISSGSIGGENSQPKAVSLYAKLQCNIQPAKIFDLKIFVYGLSNSVGANRGKSSLAADAVAYWRLPKQRSSISFTAVNLLFADRYERGFADALSEQIAFIRAVNPFFLLSFDKSF